MKTEELISALVADGARPVSPISRSLRAAFAIGAILAITLFVATLRPRPDLWAALRTPAFIFKIALGLLLSGAAVRLLSRAAGPLPARRGYGLLVLIPILLGFSVVVELHTVPSSLWTARLIGHNASHCISIIPLLSAFPAICLLLGLRDAAPAHPAVAGALAGLASGGLGAALYGLTCPDDSPLFVATWYSFAILVVAAATATVGRHALRW